MITDKDVIASAKTAAQSSSHAHLDEHGNRKTAGRSPVYVAKTIAAMAEMLRREIDPTMTSEQAIAAARELYNDHGFTLGQLHGTWSQPTADRIFTAIDDAKGI